VTPRRFTGYIPDTPFLYERLTVTEFFEFTGDLYKIPGDEVDREREQAFTLFGLNEHSHTLVKDLSHGYRQRLIYAATFLHKPKILFVDEPFIGLDPFSIRMIHDLLRTKVKEGMTIFLTTHILAFAERLADRIGIISRGRLIALGTLEEIKTLSAVEGRLEDVFLSLTA
ncbi:MAG: ABC transporter ATP-binding protein, partial [Lentisphaerae bacterium]|nr:ABC transporter ATP-binding protein [Lentisphaerota bacterium]